MKKSGSTQRRAGTHLRQGYGVQAAPLSNAVDGLQSRPIRQMLQGFP
jgi:hypothetical protein